MRQIITAAAVLAITTSALAAEPVRKNTIGVNLAGETLGRTGSDEDHTDWTEKSVRLRRDVAPRTLAEAGVSNTRRFGLSDSQVNGALVWPIGDRFVASVDGAYSSTHRILPRNAIGGALQYEFKRAWLIRGGVRTTRYEEDRVNQSVLSLEHYFRDYGITASWMPTHVFGVTAHSYSLQAGWYYGDRDSVSLTLSTGREASTVRRGGVVLGKVESVGIGGRHMISPAWAANYGISYTRQAGLYTRKGLSVGLAYSY